MGVCFIAILFDIDCLAWPDPVFHIYTGGAGANSCDYEVLCEAEVGIIVHRPHHGSVLGSVLAWAR